jgi:hypothetical protein
MKFPREAACPATVAAADELTSVPLHEEFRFGMDVLLDGLEKGQAQLTAGALRVRNVSSCPFRG